MGYGNYIDLAVDMILRETEKALLLRLPSGQEIWMPTSQIADHEEYRAGDCDLVLSITEWIAREKGLD